MKGGCLGHSGSSTVGNQPLDGIPLQWLETTCNKAASPVEKTRGTYGYNHAGWLWKKLEIWDYLYDICYGVGEHYLLLVFWSIRISFSHKNTDLTSRIHTTCHEHRERIKQNINERTNKQTIKRADAGTNDRTRKRSKMKTERTNKRTRDRSKTV